MFCNKCGSQVPDGMNFCNNCGNPMANAASQAPQQPMYQQPPMQQPMYQPPVAPMQQPEPPEKKKTGLIIGIVAGVLAVIVAAVLVWGLAFDGFGLKDKDDDKDEKKDSTTTSAVVDANNNNNNGGNSNQQPNTPVVEYDLDDAEDVALEYFAAGAEIDFADAFDCEITGWEFLLDTYETHLFKSYQEEYGPDATLDEMYSELSEAAGFNITGIEDLFDVMMAEIDPSDTELDLIVESKKEISKSEAKPYIDEIKDQIDEYSEYGADSDDIEWDEIESYAEIALTNNAVEDSKTVYAILGYLDGDWKIIAISSEGETSLTSIQFLKGMIS